jgi:hypothetical protein
MRIELCEETQVGRTISFSTILRVPKVEHEVVCLDEYTENCGPRGMLLSRTLFD